MLPISHPVYNEGKRRKNILCTKATGKGLKHHPWGDVAAGNAQGHFPPSLTQRTCPMMEAAGGDWGIWQKTTAWALWGGSLAGLPHSCTHLYCSATWFTLQVQPCQSERGRRLLYQLIFASEFTTRTKIKPSNEPAEAKQPPD